MNYHKKWDESSKNKKSNKLIQKIRSWGLIIFIITLVSIGFIQLIKESPEQIAFKQEVKNASLEGKIKEFPIEGRNHISAETNVNYKTNPPTSGSHLGEAEGWGVYNKEIDDKAGVHNLEHGGIWISYKDISAEEISILKDIGKQNPQSTIISPRSKNDSKIVIVSWGKMMKLKSVDKVLIQKYINTYKNHSPEKLAI